MYFIVIRKQRENDTPQISEVLRNAYVSNITNMFLGSVFSEATIQIIVILAAIQFIFFQVPFLYCIFTIPAVLLLMYIIIYGIVIMKSAQVMYEKKPLVGWVAETYEPFFHIKDPASCWYKIIDEKELEKMEIKPEGRKKIVGTVAVMKHFYQPEWCWLYRVAVDQKYRRKGIALHLISTAQGWCKANQINRIELAMSEYNEGARQLFDKAGFEIKQLYHKKQFTSIYMLQMYLLTCEVRPTFS